MAAKFVVIVAFLALVTLAQAGVVRRDAPAPAGLSLEDAEKLNTERQNKLDQIIAKAVAAYEKKRKEDSDRMLEYSQLYRDSFKVVEEMKQVHENIERLSHMTQNIPNIPDMEAKNIVPN